MAPFDAAERHLAAVWVADIVGFTALSAENEEGAMRQLQLLREATGRVVGLHKGRVAEFLGDSALAEFPTAEDSLRAAEELRREFSQESTEAGVPGTLRIGVHVGEVVPTAEGSLHGEGVTTASRLQEDAKPDEILVSEDVHRQLRKRDEFGFEPAGVRELRGLQDPVPTFQARMYQEGSGPGLGKGRALGERAVAMARSRPTRVMLYAGGVYLAATWTAVQAVAFLEERYFLSPHLTDLVLAGLLLFVPSVLILGYHHGGSGMDRLALPQKAGLSANLALAGLVLFLTFGGKDLGAVMRTVTVTDEEGRSIERLVPKEEFRKRLAVFPVRPPEGDPDGAWLAHGLSTAVAVDLSQDMFLDLRTPPLFRSRLRRAGVPDGVGLPVSLQREIAQELHLPYFLGGDVERTPNGFEATMSLYDTQRGRAVAEATFEDGDALALADRVSEWVRREIGLPEWHLEDATNLPVSEVLTASLPAYRAYVEGIVAASLEDDYERALAHLEEAVALDPTFAAAHFGLFEVHFISNRPDAAFQAIQATMDHMYRLPERVQYLVRHNYYFLRGEVEESYQVLEMAVELFPDDLTALLMLAEIDQVRDNRERAIETLLRVMELDPEQHERLHTVASLSEDLGRFEEARGYYEEYADRFPEDYRAFTTLAGFLTRRGEHDEAREALSRARLLEPEDVGVLTQLARNDRDRGDLVGALELYSRAVEVSRSAEDRVRALRALAAYHEFRGEMVRAVEVMEEALAEATAFQPPFLVLAQRLGEMGTYVRAGRGDVATAIVEQATEELEPPLDLFVSLGWLGLALAMEDPDGIEEAIPGVEAMIATFSYHAFRPMVVYAQGRKHELRGECDQAIPFYEEEAELSPGDATVNIQLGRCHRALGAFDRAETYFQEGLRLRPMDPELHYEVALLRKDLGDVEGAREHLETALFVWEHADEEFEPAQQAREALESI